MEKERKILACDVGLKRIGLALSTLGIILPLEPIARKNRNQAASALDEVLTTREIDTLVVGLPSGGVAGYEEMQKRIRHFISLLAFKGALHYVNEDYTSVEALESSAYMRREKRAKVQKDGRLDSLSAVLILQRYLDSINAK